MREDKGRGGSYALPKTPRREFLGAGKMDGSARRLAIILVLASTITNSSAGFLVRSLDAANEWQIVFYRGLMLAVAVSGLMIVRYRSRALADVRSIGLWGVIGGLFYSGTNVCYVVALTHTTVANTVFTLSAIPLFTAVLARLFLGESVRPATWVAMAAASVGIGLMVGDGFAAGTVFGNAMALIAAFSFAAFIVILRCGRSTNMLPSTIIGGIIAAVVAAFLGGGELAVSAHDLAICLVWGGVVTTIGHVLIIFGSRYVAGAELTLLLLIEFILGPVWVWLAFDEVPGSLTLTGGAVVLAAVAGRAVSDLRRTEISP